MVIKERNEFRKIKTNVLGLDKLFYAGLDLSNQHTVIAISGNEMTEKTLLGMQMIYGISQSFTSIECQDKPIIPQFISTNKDENYWADLHLDILIAQCIQNLTKLYVSGSISDTISNNFAKTFFKLDDIECRYYKNNVYEKLPLTAIRDKTDELICQEAIYYSNRTNSLHFRGKAQKSDEENVLFFRRYDTIHDYLVSKEDPNNAEIQSVGDLLQYPINDFEVKVVSNLLELHVESEKNLYAIDLSIIKEDNTSKDYLRSFITKFRDKSKVLILIVPEEISIPDSLIDIVINLKTEISSNYMLQFLSIAKNKIQQSTLGWHQYKRRDYGIEVYPSLHTYFQQRRYLQRALVYTHSDVITDTYQQYLDKEGDTASYEDYKQKCQDNADEYYKALYPQYCSDYTSVDILERILLSDTYKSQCKCFNNHASEQIHGYKGGVTAVIGGANTYKRFLTFGGIFSSSLHKEHTLLLLLNKDDFTIRRRLACPARSKKDENCGECRDCYRYIHFMNICMGNITPDEFIYFLERQIDASFKCKKKIQRIIIDDLQILDFCFPLLKDSTLFLSALVAVCREHNIALYILCDKSGSSVSALRAVSDNVVCTDRDENGKLLIYIERFAGYNNTPSKIYCGRIKKVKDLFECYQRGDGNNFYYSLNNVQIEDQPVSSMDRYWRKLDRE